MGLFRGAERVLMSRHVTGTGSRPSYAHAYDGQQFPNPDQRIYGVRQGTGPSSQVQSGGYKRAADEYTYGRAGSVSLTYFRDRVAKGVEHLLKPSDERQDPSLQTSKLTTNIYGSWTST